MSQLQITKHEHAFLELTLHGNRLLIDPGSATSKLPEFDRVDGVVLTHIHEDHAFAPHLSELQQRHSPVFFGTAEVAAKFPELNMTVARHGDHHQLAGFEIDFSGDLHAEIHRSMPLVQNLGVLVNQQLFYPGDAFGFPEHPFEILACPTSAPWLKLSDVIDYLSEIRPKRCFPTHNALYSEMGNALYNSRVKALIEGWRGEFRYLLPGDRWEV
jgi:L-ascorbate metabolism protein UlaG (beta-lactamase superfamily)